MLIFPIQVTMIECFINKKIFSKKYFDLVSYNDANNRHFTSHVLFKVSRLLSDLVQNDSRLLLLVWAGRGVQKPVLVTDSWSKGFTNVWRMGSVRADIGGRKILLNNINDMCFQIFGEILANIVLHRDYLLIKPSLPTFK